MTFIDAYCLYNRARGTDFVSPEDIFFAGKMFKNMSVNFVLRPLKSQVWVFQSGIIIIYSMIIGTYNEKMQITKILEIIKQNGAQSMEQIASKIGVNALIIKETVAVINIY